MKKVMLFVLVLIVICLTGCSGINGYLEEKMKQQSGVLENEDYQKYLSYSEQGKLDQDGYYSQRMLEQEAAEEIGSSDSAHITFAVNEYLEVHYYLDAGLKNELTGNSCDLSPGDCIYAEVDLKSNTPSTTYGFSAFRYSEYDKEGGEIKVDVIKPDDNNRLLLQITEKDVGKDISLAPLGEYQLRTLSFRDTFLDDNEEEHDLSGRWIVNNESVSGKTTEINPLSSYIVSYEFDGDEYFFLSSEPECYYCNNEDGLVIFDKRESSEETLDYSVKLHKYVPVSIASNVLREVRVNDSDKREVMPGKELVIPHLKYGDRFTIYTDAAWPELENYRGLALLTSESIYGNGNEYKYTLLVPQKDGGFAFDPSEYSYEHGTVSFTCFGEEVTAIQYLAVEQKISYEMKTADNGYVLDRGVITVTTEEETRRQLENIHFYERNSVNVTLEQPEYGGRIEYYVNGSRIYASTYKTYSGIEITMKFFPWEGWICDYNNGEKYLVTKSISQRLTINGKSVSTVFREDDEHKPLLEVVLDQSVGENMKFTFEASGLKKKEYSYQKERFKNNCRIIEPTLIGTESGIDFSMKNRAIQTGTAIKILVEKKGEDKSGNKIEKINSSDYRLIDNLTKQQTPISIYSDTEMGSSPVYYSSIKITISLVKVSMFQQPVSLANGTVTVQNDATAQILKSGDILEGDEKVTLIITANNGYYVSGKNVKNDVYQSTMKFDKCISDMQSIIKEHPIKKYYQVTLDSNDPYGTCTFKLNGSVVSGTINVKQDDKITLEYQITDNSYVIEGATGIFGLPIGKNEKEKTVTITIDTSYNGKTLTCESFGIRVIKRE